LNRGCQGETVVKKKDSEDVLFKATVSMGFMGVTVVVMDPSGAYLCAATGKKGGMMAGSFRVVRPVAAYKGQPSEEMSGTTVYPFGVGAAAPTEPANPRAVRCGPVPPFCCAFGSPLRRAA
jgi:hypothetical protein